MKFKKLFYIAAPVLAWVVTVFVIFFVSKNLSEKPAKPLPTPPQVWNSIGTPGFLEPIILSELKEYLPKLYVVQSGSMEPAVKLGSVVIVKPQESYSANDIVTFRAGGPLSEPVAGPEAFTPEGDKETVTHRIAMRRYPEGATFQPTYITKGDANEEIDRGEVQNAAVIGKVVLSVPYLGYGVDFAKKPYGFILLVIVPATIIVYEEIRSLLLQFWKAVKKIKIRKKERAPLPKASILVPSIGAFLIFVGISGAYFFDIEESLANILGAAESFEQEVQTGDVVINELMWMGSTKGASDEWIELRNMTGQTINISGWQVTKWVPAGGGGSEQLMLTIPTGKSIAPNGFFLISQFPSGDGGSALNVEPDVVSSSVTLHNTDLQVRLFISNWDSGGTLIDVAGNRGSPLAGEHKTSTPKRFYSMERNDIPDDGTQASSWHTATLSVGFDVGEDVENKGTPKSANSSP